MYKSNIQMQQIHTELYAVPWTKQLMKCIQCEDEAGLTLKN